jgi:hypothetical protein
MVFLEGICDHFFEFILIKNYFLIFMTTNCNISETMHVGDRSTWLNSVESSCDDFKIIFTKLF